MIEFTRLCQEVRFARDQPREDQEEQLEEYARHTIARLNAASLRVTSTLTPELYRIVESVAESLELPQVPRAYVLNDPETNASAPIHWLDQQPIVMLTSGIVKLLSPGELRFPIGHELGHCGLRHVPPQDTDPEPEDERQQLLQFQLQRASEISADRVGLLATGSLMTVAMVMIKTFSGLGTRHIQLDVGAFLQQLEVDGDDIVHEWNLHSSHPTLPFRLRALIKFSESDIYLRRSGTGVQGVPLAEVDQTIMGWLDQLSGGVLADQAERQLRLVAAWTVAAICGELRADLSTLSRCGDTIDSMLLKKSAKYMQQFGVDMVQDKLDHALRELTQIAESEHWRQLQQALGEALQDLQLNGQGTRAYKVTMAAGRA